MHSAQSAGGDGVPVVQSEHVRGQERGSGAHEHSQDQRQVEEAGQLTNWKFSRPYT